MLDIASISAVVAALGVTAGVTLAYLEVRTLVKQRQTELLASIFSHWANREWAEALEKVRTRESRGYSEYAKEYGLTEFYQVMAVFEEVGYLVHRKLIDKDSVCEIIRESTTMTWEKVKPMIEDARKRFSQRKSGEYAPLCQWTEYLYNEMQQREPSLQQLPQQ